MKRWNPPIGRSLALPVPSTSQTSELVKVPSSAIVLQPRTVAPLAVVCEYAEIELYGRRNELPPPARMYIIKIDGRPNAIDSAGLTGRQLLELAGKHPAERFAIFLRWCDGHTQVLPHNCVINFNTLGLECLVTLPLDQTEGTR